MSDQLTFEEAIKRLEEIVRYLEKGQIPLEDAVQSYEEGMKLRQFCETQLQQAKTRIETVSAQYTALEEKADA